MREGVPELVGVDRIEAGVFASALQHLPHARVGHGSLLSDPEAIGVPGHRVPIAIAEVSA
jgi:hypothetical protein